MTGMLQGAPKLTIWNRMKESKGDEMYRNYDYARAFSPSIIDDLHLAEEYLYFWKDPHGCMLKIGASFEDLMVHHIGIKEDISLPFEATLIEYINYIEQKFICPKKILQAMKYIHRKRNLANHEGWCRTYDAEVCLVQINKILGWCVIKYGLGRPTKYRPLNGIIEADIDFRGCMESLVIPRI